MTEAGESAPTTEDRTNAEIPERYPYSSIVILPYGSRIAGIAGEKIVPERKTRIRLSSYSAMVTGAAEILYKTGVAPRIIALGENSFGPKHPSTADLMKELLIKKGVPENIIIPQGNLQDTDEQIEALQKQNPELLLNPLYVVMDFHENRVQMVLSNNELPGETRSAEDILLRYFERKYTELRAENPEKYEELMKHHREQLGKFTPAKIRIAESVFNQSAKLGILHKPLLRMLRTLRGGATVTDFHNLESANKHLKKAKQAIRNGRLEPASTPDRGITQEEALS